MAALKEIGTWSSQRQAKSNTLRAIDRVAEQLNETRAVCRKYYVHPAVIDAYTAGTMLDNPAEWNEASRKNGARD